MAELPEGFDDACPRCGDPIDRVQARGTEVVLVPCGHTVQAMSALDVPPDERA